MSYHGVKKYSFRDNLNHEYNILLNPKYDIPIEITITAKTDDYTVKKLTNAILNIGVEEIVNKAKINPKYLDEFLSTGNSDLITVQFLTSLTLTCNIDWSEHYPYKLHRLFKVKIEPNQITLYLK